MKRLVPSALTAVNLVCGFIAILVNDPVISPLLIFFGAFVDLFDGLSARLLNASSAFGKELDSLADMVTFGVAPAYLYYHTIIPDEGTLSLVCTTILPVGAAMRLAKFNSTTSQESSFRGLPTPACGIFIASIPFVLEQSAQPDVINGYLGYTLPVTFALLMILPFKAFSFKQLSKGFLANILIYIYLLVVVGLFIFWGWSAIPVSIVLYVLFSISNDIYSRIRN